MNHIKLYIRFICLFSVLSLAACSDDYSESYLANNPVYLRYEELRNAIKFDDPQDITKPGRIYFKGDTLFIVESYSGVHVVKVSNPASPEKVGFITIPGCTDLSIRNSTLIANSFVDLVAVDISDLSNIHETARLQNAFQYAVPETENDHPYGNIDKTKGVVVDWEVKRIENDLNPSSGDYYPTYDKEIWDGAYLNNGMSSGGGGGAPSFGTAGSTATFGLYDRYLYILTNYYYIAVYDVNSPSKIEKMNNISSGADSETMFIYDGHMFLGTTTGVRVFSLATPSNPTSIATYSHITACDPVVIQNGYAYYTLRGGTSCNISGINRLDVMKLSNDYLSNELVGTYGMTEPYGLGIDNNTLFVCDGNAGLKVYDVTDKTKVDQNKLAEFPSIHAYDVIPMDGYLFAIGEDGFYLYDYSDLKNIKQISMIPAVTKK